MAYVELTGIDGVSFVWVDNNTKETRVGVDEFSLEANFQVMEDRSIIQEGQVSHILALLKLWRVDLANLVRLEDFFLEKTQVLKVGFLKRHLFKF